MSGGTYVIETVGDLAKIPSDRLEACFRDLQYAIELHHLIHGAASDAVPFGPITWADDGDHSVTVRDHSGELVVELKVEQLQKKVTP